MEKLKSLVPEKLQQQIATSTARDVLSTSYLLIGFLLDLEQFQLLIEDLADPKRALCAKDRDAAMELKQKGNRCYSNGNYSTALSYYSKALKVAPSEAADDGKDLVSVLFVNRAAVLYKLDRPMECKRDCDRALKISPSYAKAWFWRGKANAALEDYGNASSDLKISNVMEASSGGRRQIESELSAIMEKLAGGQSSSSRDIDDDSGNSCAKCEAELECIVSPDKGRGMVLKRDVPPSSLVHVEAPYAAVISKQSRDSYCHYCFDELPADPVPCTSCSIPLYCSDTCRAQAGGKMSRNCKATVGNHRNVPEDLKRYVEDIIVEKCYGKILGQFHEHEHECSGPNWSAVLPSELVLAGRIIAKALRERGDFLDNSNPKEPLDLCHSYSELLPETKLESHIYSMVLLCCLRRSSSFEVPVNAVSVSRTVILLSQIRVNSMAVVRIKSCGRNLSRLGIDTSSIEQVKVGLAIYLRGSLFNHSCKPNVNIYFLSRNLYIRTTEQVPRGHPLELSYGPQIGQWTCRDRLKFLKEQYSFQCRCSGCSTVNLPDLVLNAIHCASRDCDGIVMETEQAYSEREKIKHGGFITSPKSLEPYMQIENLKENAGYCLKCKSSCDLRSSRAAIDDAWADFERLKDEVATSVVSQNSLHSGSESLLLLKLRLHRFNKRIAEAEDILAQAFCTVGDFQTAYIHCSASIEILEHLYGPDHIVISYELLKLLSIQTAASSDSASPEIAGRIGTTLKRYYGSHADTLFPDLRSLRRDTGNFVQ